MSVSTFTELPIERYFRFVFSRVVGIIAIEKDLSGTETLAIVRLIPSIAIEPFGMMYRIYSVSFS